METFVFKIREEFLKPIREGIKKREYRLNDEQRSQIKIGDILVLVSNQDPKNYVRVRVSSTSVFPSWEEALSQFWDEDFSGLFSSLGEAVHKCRQFYTSDEVKRYGIVALGINYLPDPEVKGSCVLLDTNIVIQRESYSNVSQEVVNLYYWLDKLGCKKYIHPSLREEISRYKDEKIRKGLEIKLGSYELLSPAKQLPTLFQKVTSAFPLNENSRVDNELLLQVVDGTVDFLITNDREMLRKAEALYVNGQVFSAPEFLSKVEHIFPSLIDYPVLKVKRERFSDVDLNAPFFDSLRKDYNLTGKNEFDAWFLKKRKENEPIYVYRSDGEIQGFLYLKTEELGAESYKDITPVFSPKKRLKVGTFKIVSTGLRVGERFLKLIFDNALLRDVDEIYVTLFEKRRNEIDALAALLKKWGFVYWGTKSDGESVLVKNMRRYDSLKDPKFNFPVSKPNRQYFFLPIEPQYHSDLFPDSILTNEDITLYGKDAAHRYALEKVYISGKDPAFITAQPGDVLVIYRKGDRWPKKYSSVVTGLAIFESAIKPANLSDFLKECKNITVFSPNELASFFNAKKYQTIIKLLYLKTFSHKVTLEFLQQNNIVDENGGPRPLQALSEPQVCSILNKTKGSDEK